MLSIHFCCKASFSYRVQRSTQLALPPPQYNQLAAALMGIWNRLELVRHCVASEASSSLGYIYIMYVGIWCHRN